MHDDDRNDDDFYVSTRHPDLPDNVRGRCSWCGGLLPWDTGPEITQAEIDARLVTDGICPPCARRLLDGAPPIKDGKP